MPKKPKSNYSAENMPEKDRCQSPDYAIEPLLPYLERFKLFWECACGSMYMADALNAATNKPVIASDIIHNPQDDFFCRDLLATPYGGKKDRAIITNPPFSLKFRWLARCYELGYPFALLMPADTLFAASANKLFQKHGIEIIIVNPRIDFHMPFNGWKGTSDFATAWFTWGLDIGQMISFADISEAKKRFKETLNNEA